MVRGNGVAVAAAAVSHAQHAVIKSHQRTIRICVAGRTLQIEMIGWLCIQVAAHTIRQCRAEMLDPYR